MSSRLDLLDSARNAPTRVRARVRVHLGSFYQNRTRRDVITCRAAHLFTLRAACDAHSLVASSSRVHASVAQLFTPPVTSCKRRLVTHTGSARRHFAPRRASDAGVCRARSWARPAHAPVSAPRTLARCIDGGAHRCRGNVSDERAAIQYAVWAGFVFTYHTPANCAPTHLCNRDSIPFAAALLGPMLHNDHPYTTTAYRCHDVSDCGGRTLIAKTLAQ